MNPMIAAGIIGGGMGLVEGAVNRRANRKDATIAYERQQALMEKSQQQQYEMWQRTNYQGQMEQIEKAGLNPALLYGTSGGGATTTGSSSGHAPMATAAGSNITGGMGMAIQLGLMKAQKENIEADTANKQADTANKPIQGENIKASTENLMQGLDNLREDYEIKRLQQTMANIENYEKQATQEDRIDYIGYQTKSALRALRTLNNEGKVSDETINEKITIIQRAAIQAGLQNELTGVDIASKETQINIWIQENMREWDKMSQDNRRIRVGELLQEFQNDPNNKMLDGIGGLIDNIFITIPKKNTKQR